MQPDPTTTGTDTPKLTVGQQLWYAPYERRNTPGYVTVVKVGRIWATMSGGSRISLDDLTLESPKYGIGGQIYLSRDLWVVDVRKNKAWFALREKLQCAYQVPANVTEAQIREAAALLGIVIPEPSKDYP